MSNLVASSKINHFIYAKAKTVLDTMQNVASFLSVLETEVSDRLVPTNPLASLRSDSLPAPVFSSGAPRVLCQSLLLQVNSIQDAGLCH